MPSSRSRTMESPLTRMVTTKVSSPTIPGTMNQRERRSGLCQARGMGAAAGSGRPCAASHAVSKSEMMVLA